MKKLKDKNKSQNKNGERKKKNNEDLINKKKLVDAEKVWILLCYFWPQATLCWRSNCICHKGGFFSESEIRFSNLPISQKNYSKKLSWAWNLKFPPISVNNLFKFKAQDSFLEYFFWEIGRFEKRISLSEKKPSLVPPFNSVPFFEKA